MRVILEAILDLVGLLVLVAAATVAVWPYSPPGGLAIAGLGLLGASWLISKRRPSPRPGGGA